MIIVWNRTESDIRSNGTTSIETTAQWINKTLRCVKVWVQNGLVGRRVRQNFNKIIRIWDMMSRSMVQIHRYIGGLYFLYVSSIFYGRWRPKPCPITIKWYVTLQYPEVLTINAMENAHFNTVEVDTQYVTWSNLKKNLCYVIIWKINQLNKIVIQYGCKTWKIN